MIAIPITFIALIIGLVVAYVAGYREGYRDGLLRGAVLHHMSMVKRSRK